MQTFTNSKNLPQPIFDAITFSDFAPAGTISSSRLSEAPQITYLKKNNETSTDVIDMVWVLMQRALLQVIENGSPNARYNRAMQVLTEALTETITKVQQDKNTEEEAKKEITAQIPNIVADIDALIRKYFPADTRYLYRQSFAYEVETQVTAHKGSDKEFTSSQKVSIFDTIPLYDKELKTLYYPRICETYHATKADMRKNWIREANIQAFLLQQNGYEVENIECIMVFKDWSKGKIDAFKDYPSSQCQTMTLPLREQEKTKRFILARAQQYIRMDMGDVALCSAEDRWEQAGEYVVVRENNPTSRPAKGKFLTEADAKVWLAKNRISVADGIVKHRPGKSVRCESYCPVRDYCEQRKVL